MNENIKEILHKECTKLNRYLRVPAIYRHFKLNKDNEQMLYAVTNVSLPIDRKEFDTIATSVCNGFYMMHHTELEFKIPVVRVKDRYYHSVDADKDILVMYTGLYGPRESYLRPLPMFLSKVDKEKYPNATQKYRLEEI